MADKVIEDIVRLLAILGGIIAIIEAIITVIGVRIYRTFYYHWILGIFALIFAILVLLATFRPDNPIPYHWIILIIFGILLIVCGSLIGGVLVLVGGILKLIFELI